MEELTEAPPRPRVLFDTNVLFGARYRRAITRLVDRDNPAFTPLWSEWIIGELYYALAWRWAESYVAQSQPLSDGNRRAMGGAAKGMLELMLPHFELISLQAATPFDEYPFIPDPDDRHLFVAAERGRATVVVLGDGPVLRAARRSGGWGDIRLVEPEPFITAFDPDQVEPPEPDEP